MARSGSRIRRRRRCAPTRTPEPAPGGGDRRGVRRPRSSSTPGIWCRSSTRWCAGCGSTGQPVSAVGGGVRVLPAVVLPGGRGGRRATGWPALVPARPGPRRAHKLTDEVVAFARQLREADPALRSARSGRRDRRAGSGSRCTRARWSGRWPGLRTPKVEARDERSDDAAAAVRRRRPLRAAARAGRWPATPGGWRLRAGACCSTAGWPPGCAPGRRSRAAATGPAPEPGRRRPAPGPRTRAGRGAGLDGAGLSPRGR